ncbi:MAG: radical SAM protein, partial [Polyangia bacterium]
MSESWPLKLCVWELTLACNARCTHCGSDAGKPRPDELDTAEALVVIAELARLGAESVTFSGGEPLLRSDWPQLARAVRAAGMSLDMITNGLLAAKQADVIAGCGFSAVTFSIDGPAPVHDFLRGLDGGLGRTLEGARALRKRGVRIGAAT